MLKIIVKILGVLFLLGVVFPLVVLLIFTIWYPILS
jgi:K+-transporting ATPase c subunit